MSNPEPTILAQTRDRLGESAMWRAGEQAIYWVDLYGPVIHRMPLGGPVESWVVPSTRFIGSFVFVSGGRLMLAVDTGLVLFDPASGLFTPFADPNAGREAVIYNDSKLDRSGRLWVGTLDLAETEPRGILYAVDAKGHAALGDSGFIACNGPAFSPRGDILYFSDSLGRRLLAYDLPPGGSALRNRRVFVSLSEDEGVPDGLTVDAEGGVWCAHYGIGRLTRYSPEGAVLMTLDLPCPIVTSMSFGGPDMTMLFVTTGWSPGVERAGDEPGPGGALMAFETGIVGLPEPEFDIG
ncbi:SMP-30/gluconolactonase/LRE family protein [Aestuariivirga sp.]|uniref:SMP-30/gluconolactonase/LRE family protein n=1 Tax=Aestuariivirga sp. TaxID=2650926 RepID=UPI0035AE00EE